MSDAMNTQPFFRVADLRRIEAAAAAEPLMQRAGLAAADLAKRLCAGRDGAVLILAGPGNNGGDAFEAAGQLHRRGFATCVVFVGEPEALPADAAAAYRRFTDTGGLTVTDIPADQKWALIIDGFFGIGLSRRIGAPYKALINTANSLAERKRIPLLALDCPSGINGDSGRLHGTGIRASHTISFIGAKPGLFMADGPDHCGKISIAMLDLDAASLAKGVSGQTIAPALFADRLRPRLRNSHKGLYGNAGIIGGARGMTGAALLAARAALRLGSGKVFVGLTDPQAPSFDVFQPELMLRSARDLLDKEITELSVLACGPGLGRSQEARFLLETACQQACPLVLDADALNLLASEPDLHVAVASRCAPTVLTPHPSEAARLLDSKTADIQADRLAAATELASRFNAHVALKGCGTVLATPDGTLRINTNGNPGLASAGSGDVLTGIITALIAQGWPAPEALAGAVHLHGAAADALVAAGIGPIGIAAGELIDAARLCLNQWIISNN